VAIAKITQERVKERSDDEGKSESMLRLRRDSEIRAKIILEMFYSAYHEFKSVYLVESWK